MASSGGEAGASVEVGTVVEHVVRNAMEKLVEKQQSPRTAQGGIGRKRELARYFEETRRQLTSVLALVRWQQRRTKVTTQCEDLIESLERHRAHTTGTSERMCIAAEETAHHHRTPMYDMRTAVDVLAAGTYRGLPSMDMDRIIAPRVSDGEKDEVIKQLDFILRAEMLRMHIPPELSKVEVRNGRLLLESADEFQLELSLRLELPQKPFRVDRLQLLVKAVDGALPPCQGLADLLEKRMVVHEREPLDEAVRILGDAARVRTWHILHAQSQGLLLFPKVDVEATTSSFVIYYWQDSPMLSFEALMTAAVRTNTAAQQQASNGDGAAGGGGAIASHIKGRAPCLVLMSNRDMQSRVQIKHLPPLVKDNGQALDIPIKRSALDLGAILDYALKQHARCRLRLLHRCLDAEGAAGLESAGMTPHLSDSGHELIIKIHGVPRLSIVVDHRSGELEARDLEARGAGSAAHDKLETGLHKALFKEVKGAAAHALLTWRANDMLAIMAGLAPALGLRPAPRLLTYSHSQATQVQSIVGDKKPALFLQLAGSGILDSGYRDFSKPEPKPGAQDISTLVVQCDASKCSYSYRLVILSVGKANKGSKQPYVYDIDPYEDELAVLQGTGGGQRDDIGRALPKRHKVMAADASGVRHAIRHTAAVELSRVVELVTGRVNLIKLQRQLDTHTLSWRAAGGVLLLALPCVPIQARELRLRLDPSNTSMLTGGQAGWTVEMHLTCPSMPPNTKQPRQVIAAPSDMGLLESIVQLCEEPGDGDLCRHTLVFSFPCIHAESICDMRMAVQGVVTMARLAHEVRAFMGTHIMNSPTLSEGLLAAIKVEAVGYTALVLRLVTTGELVVIRCRAKGGLVVTIGEHAAHPLAAHMEVALDAGKSLASVLAALVTVIPVLSAVKLLEAAPGDIVVLPYSLEGVAIVFRGCFALYICSTSNAEGEEAAVYSVGDLCPQSQHRALPWGLDSSFMPHAAHTGGTISSLADTLWNIPTWPHLVSAVAQYLTHLPQGDAHMQSASTAGASAKSKRMQGGPASNLTAIAHVDDKRSALVCCAQHLQPVCVCPYGSIDLCAPLHACVSSVCGFM